MYLLTDQAYLLLCQNHFLIDKIAVSILRILLAELQGMDGPMGIYYSDAQGTETLVPLASTLQNCSQREDRPVNSSDRNQ